MKRRYKIAGWILGIFGVAFLVLGFVISRNADCRPAPPLAAGAARSEKVLVTQEVNGERVAVRSSAWLGESCVSNINERLACYSL